MAILQVNLDQPGEPGSARWTWVSQVNLGQPGEPGSARWTWVSQVNPDQPGEPGSARWTRSARWAWVSQVNPGPPGESGSARWTRSARWTLVSWSPRLFFCSTCCGRNPWLLSTCIISCLILVGWSLTSLFSTNMLYQRRVLHPSSVSVLPENALTCKKLDCLPDQRTAWQHLWRLQI